MRSFVRRLFVGMFLLGATFLSAGHGQSPAKIQPKLEPVAETRLLMEGLAHPNFRGVERKLMTKPTDTQTWVFARGQALLIAETANLLMLRPPKNQGQPIWFERSIELRTQSIQLAQYLAQKDFERSRTSMQQLAASCNRCHQTFRINIEIAPFQQPNSSSPQKVE